jgi:hypothetical protein
MRRALGQRAIGATPVSLLDKWLMHLHWFGLHKQGMSYRGDRDRRRTRQGRPRQRGRSTTKACGPCSMTEPCHAALGFRSSNVTLREVRGLVRVGHGHDEYRGPDQATSSSAQSGDRQAFGLPSGVCTHGAAADVDGWLPDAAAKRQELECRNKSRAGTAECRKAALTNAAHVGRVVRAAKIGRERLGIVQWRLGRIVRPRH